MTELPISEPPRAAVRPMVFGRFGGPAIPLESAVARMLRAKLVGPVLVCGGPGSGRSTAVDHLRASIAGEPAVQFLDEPLSREVIQAIDRQLLVFTGPPPTIITSATVNNYTDDRILLVSQDGIAKILTPFGRPIQLLDFFTLAPWGRDQWIEYALARHSDMIQSVLARALRPENARFMGGSPLLAAMVLDAFAAEAAVESAQSVVRTWLFNAAPSQPNQHDIETVALNFMFGGDPEPNLSRLRESVKDWRVIQLLQSPSVQAMIAAERVVRDLANSAPMKYLIQRFKPQLIRVIADELKSNKPAYSRLV